MAEEIDEQFVISVYEDIVLLCYDINNPDYALFKLLTPRRIDEELKKFDVEDGLKEYLSTMVIDYFSNKPLYYKVEVMIDNTLPVLPNAVDYKRKADVFVDRYLPIEIRHIFRDIGLESSEEQRVEVLKIIDQWLRTMRSIGELFGKETENHIISKFYEYLNQP